MKCLHLIVNSKSGKGFGATLPELAKRVCSDAGIDLKIYADGDIDSMAGQAVKNAKPGDVIAAAGGDGTIRAVADEVSKTEHAFAVIPCGTFNFFARAHGIPEDHEAALKTAATGKPKPVRLGEVNGRVFLVNASLGLYAKSIEEREQATARFGRKRLVVILSTLKTLLSRHRLLLVRFKTGEAIELRQTPMVFIGNNAMQLRNLKLSVAKCFRQDMLAVVTLKPVRGWEMLRVIWRGITKTLEKEERLDQAAIEDLDIETKRRSQTVALDGEMFEMRSPLKVRSKPEAIRLMVPDGAPA